ncbi:MAG TPA: NAD(P)/FAD-dependent oxidoreductase [Thermoanaerobaculia bacterium]|nr:NAD(P)/FAD-dependent oxidoreductase [Thermoanaerobaculia bacterium]
MDYDVIVIGGGPGGAAAATLTAQRGHRVLLLERAPAPRFKLGESLMPATYWTLERMGALAKMKESHFPKKYSVQFYGKSGKASSPFYFQETDPHESSQTWQVLRSEFDAMLLENAAEQGVDVRWGATVKDVLFDGDRALGVRADFGEGDREVPAKVVVDASGQSSLIAKKLGLRQPDPELKKASFFTHFEGAYRDPGIDEGATLVLHTNDASAWFWYIPLPDNRVSVGVVGGLDALIAGRQGDPQKIFDEEVAKCPPLQQRIEGACQVFPVQAIRDFSYRSSRIAGDGWVLVGDAFGFLDPIYSSGVFLALKSGELAADSIHDALTAGDVSGEKLGAHGPGFLAGMEAMRKLVYAFYEEGFSFAQFLAKYPQHRLDIVHLLVGNVSVPTNGLFKDMATMVRLPEEATLDPAPAGAAH